MHPKLTVLCHGYLCQKTFLYLKAFNIRPFPSAAQTRHIDCCSIPFSIINFFLSVPEYALVSALSVYTFFGTFVFIPTCVK
jgi:hypothetical protein